MSHLEEGLLHALVDGEIPSAELPPIQAHLAACAECRGRLEETRHLLADADGLVDILEVPAAPHTSGRPRMPAPRRRAPWRELAWAASLLGAVGVGYVARGRTNAIPPATKEAQVVAATPANDSGVADAATPQSALASAESNAPQSAASPPPSQPLSLERRSRAPAAPPLGRGSIEFRRQADQAAAPAERKQEIAATAGARADSTTMAPTREPQPAPAPPVTAAAPGQLPKARLRDELPRLEELRANSALGLSASRDALAPAEPISLPDALRRLGGSLRLIDGMVALRLEAQGPYVRVVYPAVQGELVLQQQLIDGRVLYALLAPPGFPPDSLARLRARVRE